MIRSGYGDAYRNMAVDEAIFSSVKAGATPLTLRIYGWRPYAFSLGYFQDVAATLDTAMCRKDSVSFVRRMTGGGAIFHHRELTYSLACPACLVNEAKGVAESFKSLCSFITGTYRKLGLAPEFAGAPGSSPRTRGAVSPDSFCFSSREKYDILLEGRKIGGNAQKRHKDMIFQHGSIPLESDLETAFRYLLKKPEDLEGRVCALEEILKRKVAFGELELRLIESFKEAFCVDLRESTLTSEEQRTAALLREEKYSSDAWNVERKIPRACAKTALA